MNSEQRLQTLRTIDKVDKIGIDGVVELLQKPADEFGVDLMECQAILIGEFCGAKGETNSETISKLRDQFARMDMVSSRFKLIGLMEENHTLDVFLALKPNKDNTWKNRGRPENIAWALDDIISLCKNNMAIEESVK